MNGRLSALDRYTLISNSDAHSPDKLGREANRLSCGLSYPEIRQALHGGRGKGFLGTVEFFPEQGKYHLDGHRKCACRMVPSETLERGGLCPVCGKKVTVGVMHRVELLADRPEGTRHEGALPYERLISLAEVVGEVKGAGPNTQGVRTLCRHLVERLGPEMGILSRVPLEDVRREGGSLLEEGLRRMRAAEVLLEAGYDGEFGVVRLFRDGERDRGTGGQGPLVDLAGVETGPGRPAKRGQGRKKAADPGRGERPGTTEVRGLDPVGTLGGGTIATGEAPPAGGGTDIPETHSLLKGLNPQQLEAVLFQGAPLLIVAGPGTGKTHTLTRRIAWAVLERGIPANRILAVTFTQRAAREMEERLAALLGRTGSGSASAQVKTFHALGADLLREAGGPCGAPPDFHILGREDSLRLLRNVRPPGAGTDRKAADRLLERISLAKKDLLYPEDGREPFPDQDFLEAYGRYQEELMAYRALDYEDLVSLPVRALERLPGWLQSVRDRYQAVCVDEYQDVNHAQYRFLKLVCSSPENLCVIGDPHQAIYGFRGASPSYFLQFDEDFPGARQIRLARNYRSTATILSASVKMISRGLGTGEAPPRLVPAGGHGGERVRVAELATEKSEAIFIAQTVEALLGGTDSLSLYAGKVPDSGETLCNGFGDVAVLYRLNALGPGLEGALRYQGIPCQGAAQSDRWQGRPGRALLALVLWMCDPGDRLSLERIQAAVKAPPEKVLREMERYSREKQAARASLKEWVTGLESLEWIPLREEGWKDSWGVLVRAAVSYPGDDAAGLVRSLSLWQEPDLLERRIQKVTLTTLHAAKGLEFPVVFIAGCERGLIPWEQGSPPPDPAEERRLFFVGMTRACRLLFLTGARSRFLHGERGSPGPSPFLGDIPPDHVERVLRTGERKKRKPRDAEQPLLFKSE